jgi:predicted XRE-type DNA-binding protein
MRRVSWVKAAWKEFDEFPRAVQEQAKFALEIAAQGSLADIAKPMKGFDVGVFEIAMPYRGVPNDLCGEARRGHMGPARLPEEVDPGHQDAEARDRPDPRSDPTRERAAEVSDKLDVVRGSGNVFADFGDPDASAKQMKAIVAAEIIETINARAMTVRAAAEAARCDAADIQRIRNADLSRFTLDRLIRIAGRLGRRAEIRMLPGDAAA